MDSLIVLPALPPRLAQVRFLSTEPIHGQHLRVDMTVAASGNLHEMDVVTNPDRSLDDVVSTALGVIMVGVYALIGLALFIAFVRRIMARLIDVKGSMLDALALGILIGRSLGI